MAKVNPVYTICEEGASAYSIIIPEKATYCINQLAQKLQKELTPYTTDPIAIIKDGDTAEHDSSKEILLYKTNRPESAAALCSLGYTDYSVSMAGGKIVFAGHSEASMCDAVDRFLLYMNAFKPTALIGKPKATMPEGYVLFGKVKRFVSNIPVYAGGKLAGVSAAESDSYTVSIDETNEKEYKSYLALLEKNGYVKYTDNDINGNLFATYTNAQSNIFCEYIPCYSKVKISVTHKEELPGLAADNVYEDKGIKPFMAMLKMVNVVDTCGFGFVWRMSDGAFIILDGGLPEYDDKDGSTQHDQLYDFLKKHTVGGGEPVIAAWFFSHAHNDHIGCFMSFAAKYSPIVKIEQIIYSFPADEAVNTSQGPYQHKFRRIAANCGDDVKIIHQHTGQKFFIRDAEIEILYTLDDFYPKVLMHVQPVNCPKPYLKHHTYPKENSFFNDTSTIFTIKIAGQKMMMLGDATFLSADICVDMYGKTLKSDILQLGHHGSHGCTLQLYEHIVPEVMLFPVATDRFMERIKLSLNSALIDRLNVKEMFLSGAGDTVLELPYKPENKYE